MSTGSPISHSASWKVRILVAFLTITGTQSALTGAESPTDTHWSDINLVLDEAADGSVVHGRFEQYTSRRSHGGSALRNSTEDATMVAAFEFSGTLPRTGYFRVYAWWPDIETQSAEVLYEVRHTLGVAYISADQRETGGQWNYLGTYLFDGYGATIQVSAPKGGHFVVDALRLEFLGATPPVPTIVTEKLALGSAGQYYNAKLEAIDTARPFSWKIEQQLPSSLFLNRESGEIYGIPERAGEFTLDVSIRRGDSAAAGREITLQVLASETQSRAPSMRRSADTEMASLAASESTSNTRATVDITEILGLLESLPEGNWLKANTNLFSDVWTPPHLRSLNLQSNETPAKIIEAWSSFAWDSNRADLIIYGGGHANYSGNDVYRWRTSTRRWERASLPSEIMQDDGGTWMAIDGPDNAPASAHTYDNTVFLKNLDKYLTFGGAAYNHGGGYRRLTAKSTYRSTGPYLFDPSRADADKVGGTTGSHVQREGLGAGIIGGEMWENRDMYATARTTDRFAISFINSTSAYVEENGKDVIYTTGRIGGGTSQDLFKFTLNDVNDPSLDTWEQVGKWWNGATPQGVGAYNRLNRVFVRTGDSTKPFAYWDLNTPGPDNRDVVISPLDSSGEFVVNSHYGIDFDPVRGHFVLWGGGGSVWALVPPPAVTPDGWFVVKQPPPTSVAPTTNTGTGILGKWKYAPNLDVFVGLQGPVAGNVWFYKPIGWINPSPVAATPVPLPVWAVYVASGLLAGLGLLIQHCSWRRQPVHQIAGGRDGRQLPKLQALAALTVPGPERTPGRGRNTPVAAASAPPAIVVDLPNAGANARQEGLGSRRRAVKA